ncbi:MAG TPA: hypothetical protein VFG19_14690 [Geobacteraceae bacterium]|nr:hypothetical protein [Geobacteraceae bacterium]
MVEARVGSNQGKFSPKEDEIKFDDELVSEGVHKLILKDPLEPGQYGLIAHVGNSGYLVYDFVVEPE